MGSEARLEARSGRDGPPTEGIIQFASADDKPGRSPVGQTQIDRPGLSLRAEGSYSREGSAAVQNLVGHAH
jgi:hypothetical protein